ncbi:hypothetical protein [Leptolyngbya sp. 'hensonii']|uniref:hypothetical protein n=1 Tax=Leptolyngbya sp. 'hensonii' TaxID=1922337 RepID=UPI00117EFFEE|nr:hypothetical protein [Leptolyngbya sp. 'hensonii']
MIVWAVAYTLVVLLVWGLPCDRIISKAGFDGGVHWILWGSAVQPFFLIPASIRLFGDPSEITNFVTGGSGFVIFLAFLMIAFVRWPIWDEVRQLRRKAGLNPDDGKPVVK